MYRIVKATYQDGVLKPAGALPLEDRQQVVVIILPIQSGTSPARPDLNRVAVMKEQTAAWLREQPAESLRPDDSPEADREQSLEDDVENALAAIRAKASQLTPEEIAADVSQALVESQMIPKDERARLEAELDALLAE
jgi:predicted DNA-binding antitoxin AbrB/MazE fold protein